MKNAMLIATLCTVTTLSACGGPESDGPSKFAVHDDSALLQTSADGFSDKTCQCQLYGARAEPLPRGCELPVKADGTPASLRFCEFPSYTPSTGTTNHVNAQVL